MKFNNIEHFEEFLQRRKHLGIKLGLERMQKMAEILNHPEKKNKFIHVAGTNGKGSTIQFIKNALLKNGYQVGVFSSPSFYGIKGYFEVGNTFIDEKTLLDYVNEIYPIVIKLDIDGDGPTEFEIVTMLAFLVFEKNVDFVLIETGMGGREDTTNIVDSIMSIITNVTYDHQQFLGQTIEEIAEHKAGIIKWGCPVVVGNLSKAAYKVIAQEAHTKHAEFYSYGHEFVIDDYTYKSHLSDVRIPLHLKLKGQHQYHNASLALTALELLVKLGHQIEWNKAIEGINETFMPGRYERVLEYPHLILDSAHNVDAVQMLIQTIMENCESDKKVLIFAAFSDKALEAMLEQLIPTFDKIYLTTFNHPRAASHESLVDFFQNDNIFWVEDWQVKIKEISVKPDEETAYFVTGSLDFITKVRNFILKG